MSGEADSKPCPCTQRLMDLLRAHTPKKTGLRKVVCEGCGKTFWANSDREYCFNCEAKYGRRR
ncbi:MAG: hypothetical protein ACE5Z5_06530 [Candidatus Bathyarchaeia archaeon]